jgi:hypothetical protein
MAMEFSEQLNFSFDPTAGRIQQLTLRTAPFRGNVTRVQALLKGFDITYNNGDHHVLREEIDLDAAVDPAHPTTVNVTARFLLRDSSGNIDDPFSGNVRAVVIAQTTAAG